MLTIEEIKEKYPKIYQAIFDEGRAAGMKEETDEAFSKGETAGYDKGKAEGLKLGAETECQRIKDVEAQALPGHENLIAELKFDGKTTGEQAAVQILQAENVMRETIRVQLEDDAPDAVGVAIPPEVDDMPVADDSLPVEERAKKKWDADAELRKEFLNDFKTYLAYSKAEDEGRVRVLN